MMGDPILIDSEYGLLEDIIRIKLCSEISDIRLMSSDEIYSIFIEYIIPKIHSIYTDDIFGIKLLALCNYKNIDNFDFSDTFTKCFNDIHNCEILGKDIISYGLSDNDDGVYLKLCFASVHHNMVSILNMIKHLNDEMDNNIQILERDIKLKNILEDGIEN